MNNLIIIVVLSCFTPAVLPAKYVLPKWKKQPSTVALYEKSVQACELPAVQSEHSHYICDDKGEPKCLPGWQGDLCDVPICRKGCDPLQGYCKRPGECRCKMGFYGERCNKCIPLPGCQHGYCNVSFECVCRDGWDGIFCSEPICRSDCHATRGFCESPGECRCRLGWAGPTCRACQSLPGCQHGYCDKPLECKCLPGYTGLLCQTQQYELCPQQFARLDATGSVGIADDQGNAAARLGGLDQRVLNATVTPGASTARVTDPGNAFARKDGEECCAMKSAIKLTADFNLITEVAISISARRKRNWHIGTNQRCVTAIYNYKLNYCEKNPDTCKNGGKCQSLESGDGFFRCQCAEGISGKHCENIPESMIPGNSTETTTTESIVVEVSTKPEDAEESDDGDDNETE
ncbi:unnamed protein product [Leptosia nina]|uniref:EGF-like domain-containing protein n=1 Tax=Leptosia nina TaxID=320188 RepID=A0AAV1J0K5_9NEOP